MYKMAFNRYIIRVGGYTHAVIGRCFIKTFLLVESHDLFNNIAVGITTLILLDAEIVPTSCVPRGGRDASAV